MGKETMILGLLWDRKVYGCGVVPRYPELEKVMTERDVPVDRAMICRWAQ